MALLIGAFCRYRVTLNQIPVTLAKTQETSTILLVIHQKSENPELTAN
jgi:hypothetical protein